MSADDLTGIRASSVVGCPRKGFYQGVGQEEEDLPRSVQRLFRIRSMQSDAVLAEKAEEVRTLGRKIVLEQDIPWGPKTDEQPDGIYTGHADWADWTEHEIIEATGSADLSPERRKILQSAFYAKRMSEITGRKWRALVYVFNPGTGEERYVPVNWESLAWELDDLFSDVLAAVELNVEPARVCKTPHDGPAHYCQFSQFCFRDWEYPPIGVIEDAGLKADVFRAYQLAKQADTKLIDADLRPLKKQVAAQLKPSAKYRVPVEGGVIEVRRTDVKGARSVSLKEIEEAGFTLPAELLPFVKEGDGHTKLETRFYEGQA